MTTFVIVGGGLAGAKAAETLRAEGSNAEIVLFGDETERPYERPALAKGYLLGKDERDSVFVHAAEWYPEHSVDLRLNAPVTSINRAARTIAFDGGVHVVPVGEHGIWAFIAARPDRSSWDNPALAD